VVAVVEVLAVRVAVDPTDVGVGVDVTPTTGGSWT
jgi:hypothetical protein